jgi:hypothetical protein
MVMTPVLLSASGFASAVKLAVPLPDPLAPAVILIQGAEGSTVAVQLQPDAAVTFTDPLEAAAGRVAEVADKLKEHETDVDEIVKMRLFETPPLKSDTEMPAVPGDASRVEETVAVS